MKSPDEALSLILEIAFDREEVGEEVFRDGGSLQAAPELLVHGEITEVSDVTDHARDG